MNKKQLPGGVRFLLGVISVLLCIVLFACSLVTILIADLGLLTSKGGLQKLVQDVLFSTSAPARPGFASGAVIPGRIPVHMEEQSIPGDIPANIPGDLFGGIAESVMNGNLNGALADTIYGILGQQMGEDVPFSKDEVAEFIDQSTLPEFISDKVSGIVVDVVNGEVTTSITKEEIVELLEENKPLLEEKLKTEIPAEIIESVGTMVEESNISQTIQQEVAGIVGIEPPSADAKPGGSTAPGEKPGSVNKPVFRPSDLEVLDNVVSGNVTVADLRVADILAMVRIITAPTVLIICIAVCLLLSALLFLTNWGRPNAALRCSGISYFLAGLLFLLPSAAAQFLPSLFASIGLAGNAIRQVLTLAGSVSLGVTVFGLVLIIAGAVLGSALKKKRIAEAAQAACVTGAAATLSEELLAQPSPVQKTEVPVSGDLSELAESLLAAEETESSEEAGV